MTSESRYTPSKVISIALHAVGACFALTHLVGVLLSGALLTAAIDALASVAKVSSGGSGSLWVMLVPIAVGGALVTQLLFSALAILVQNSDRAATATEELAESVRRLDLEKTSDGGLYYRVR